MNNKETLEETIKRLYPINIIRLAENTSYDASLPKIEDFKNGINWQVERS